LYFLHILFLNFKQFKELLTFKREKECVLDELAKAQDTISRLVLEKNSKSIDLYDPNNPEILNKKLSRKRFLNLSSLIIDKKIFYLF
jgi:hypothetical protein